MKIPNATDFRRGISAEDAPLPKNSAGLVKPVLVFSRRGARYVPVGFAEGNLCERVRRDCRKARRLPRSAISGREIHSVFGGSLGPEPQDGKEFEGGEWCGNHHTWKRHRKTQWRNPAYSARLMAPTFAKIESAIIEWWHESAGVLLAD